MSLISSLRDVRRPNWTKEEVGMLVDVLPEYPALLKHFNNSVSEKNGWDSVALSVNSVATNSRTGVECKKKWMYLKSEVRSKLKKVKGQSEKIVQVLNDLEMQVCKIMEKTPSIHENEDTQESLDCEVHIKQSPPSSPTNFSPLFTEDETASMVYVMPSTSEDNCNNGNDPLGSKNLQGLSALEAAQYELIELQKKITLDEHKLKMRHLQEYHEKQLNLLEKESNLKIEFMRKKCKNKLAVLALKHL